MVAAFAQLASHVETSECVKCLAQAVSNIVSSTTQDTKDAFATQQMVAAFAQLASHVETSECVKCLAQAVNNIVSGTTQSTKDAFATSAMVGAFSLLAMQANTPESVKWVAAAISNVTRVTNVSYDAFAAPAMVAAFTQLAMYASTEESVRALSHAIGNITCTATLTTKDAFATPEMVASFTQLAARASTRESVEELASAISNIVSSTTQDTKDAFATQQMVAAFAQLASHVETSECVKCLAQAVSNIVSSTTQDTKDAFASPTMVATFSQLASCLVEGRNGNGADSVVQLSRALHYVTCGTTPATKTVFATRAAASMFSKLASHAATSECVKWIASAMCNISTGTDSFAKDAILPTFSQLVANAKTAESAQSVARAISIISPMLDVDEIFAALSKLAPHANTAESVQQLAILINNITCGSAQATKDVFASPKCIHQNTAVYDKIRSTPKPHEADTDRAKIQFSSIQFSKRISTSSCGPVYAGTLATKEAVAIKELAAEAMDACIKECDKHMMLRHPNIVHVCGMSEDGRDHAYIVTELAPHGSLADAIKSHPQRNDWTTLVRWALDIAHGLQYLHSLSPPVLHLDLKPQNVLLFDDDTAKLCDFGIARITKPTVTCQKSLHCSPQYAAPEQFDTERVSEAADVYGFGGVLFAMITKSEPWEGLSTLRIFGKLTTGTPPSLPSPLPAECPDKLAAIVRRCLQIDPQQRCSLSQAIEDLAQVRDELAAQNPRVAAQQLSHGPPPPADVPPPQSLLEILKLFESCSRTDIPAKHQNPTLDVIVAEYNRVAYYIPRSNFVSDRDHEDAMAVGLYTDESFVYWLVNAWANDTSADRARGVDSFIRRLAEALPRCCVRYAGPAVRVLRAGEASLQAIRDAFADYERVFAEGTVLNFRGFACFARGSALNENDGSVLSPSIAVFCRVVEAFDVDAYSMVRLAGGPSEIEVLCLPPSAFRVSHPPSREEWTVSVYTEMQAAQQSCPSTTAIANVCRRDFDGIVDSLTECEPLPSDVPISTTPCTEPNDPSSDTEVINCTNSAAIQRIQQALGFASF